MSPFLLLLLVGDAMIAPPSPSYEFCTLFEESEATGSVSPTLLEFPLGDSAGLVEEEARDLVRREEVSSMFEGQGGDVSGKVLGVLQAESRLALVPTSSDDVLLNSSSKLDNS